MNEQKRKHIDGTKVFWLVAAYCVVVILSIPIDLIGQPTAAADEWYLMFSVKVSGQGRAKPQAGKENTVLDWSIDRSYLGAARLIREAKKDSMAKKGFTRYCDRDGTVLVIIDDRIRVHTEGDYQHDSWENVTARGQNIANTHGSANGVPCLDLNRATNKFELDFRIGIKGNEKNGIEAKQTIFDRSEEGLGGKPTHEEGPIENKKFAINSLQLPVDGAGLMFGDMFLQRGHLPRNYLSKWESTFGPMPLKKALIASIPETATNVKLTITYQLTRKPPF